jgi:hypothetical protein
MMDKLERKKITNLLLKGQPGLIMWVAHPFDKPQTIGLDNGEIEEILFAHATLWVALEKSIELTCQAHGLIPKDVKEALEAVIQDVRNNNLHAGEGSHGPEEEEPPSAALHTP